MTKLPYPYERLFELLDLPEDWDSYGADRINPDAAVIASGLMYAIKNCEWYFMPRPGGGVTLETLKFRLGADEYEVCIDISESTYTEVDVFRWKGEDEEFDALTINTKRPSHIERWGERIKVKPYKRGDASS